jgi:hypothetical protein
MKRDDFNAQWQRSQQWRGEEEKLVPDDETLLRLVENAQQTAMAPEVNLISFPSHRRSLWMPIAAAASIVIGVSIIGLVYFNKQDNPLPVTQIVNEEGHTVRFLCNNGCSAQDILLLANEIFK